MKTTFALAIFACFAAGFAHAADAKVDVTPVQKAIEMLNGMLKQAGVEKHEEMVQFAAFKQFCDDVSVEKQRLIEEADAEIENLKAQIQEFDAEAARLGELITTSESEIAGWEHDLEAAHKVREDENANYTMTVADYTESVVALEKAIAVLKAQNYDRPGATSMLQKLNSMRHFPEAARRTIEAFLARGTDEPEITMVAAPEADAYQFQSSDIITMLEQLEEKFKDEKTQIEKEEVANLQEYQMLVQDLHDSIKAAEKTISDSTAGVAKARQGSIDATAQLETVTNTRNDDAKYLSDLTSTCTKKAAEFDSRQKLRAEEIEALEKAVQILESDEVSGSAEKHLSLVAQRRNSTAFSQLRSSVHNPENQERVAAYLKEQADSIGSRTLAVIAMKVSADPFAKVKKLIEELITRLMTEATEEAEHKGWCDTELATNEHTRTTKAAEVESLHSEIDSLTSRIQVLAKDLEDLSTAVADLDAAVAEATELRHNETAENQATIQDAAAGSAAIDQAITVLKDFYAKAAEATALVQGKQKRQEPPPIFDAPYQGMQSENGGVIGMLEVIKSDFERLEAHTKTSESAAQSEYDKFMEDSSIDKVQKEKDIEHYTAEKAEKEGSLTEAQDSLKEAQSLLDSARAAYEKLKPACLDTGMTYEERVERRREEIEALKEALRILSGEDLPVLNQQ